ncbi:hypothetical protein COY07_02280 [Candidatus Peregrinibacteria bacterium CG_4_10_14_0_2_um_filter_43_11]|nr:MAG: hypothetical protein COY07_02280 [Candidatus Peregrinibacteria bacterium CG_4_10_14_0_2_um_filter_43_11]
MKTCKQCHIDFEVAHDDRAFYARMKVPEPTLCPICRDQRRLVWRNERSLYKRKCNLCKKDHVSIYSSEKELNVLCQECWWSDKWNGMDYGREFDFTRPFFEQFGELLKVGGLVSLFGKNNQNSEFVQHETDDKNCYLNAGGHYNEDCYFCTYSLYGKNNVDCYWIPYSELCYECIHCDHCYQSIKLRDCVDCANCMFCEECTGCEYCFGCFGLKHKKYYFFNEPLEKKEYEKRTAQISGSFENMKRVEAKARQHFLKYPHKAVQVINCQNSTGDYLRNCKNVQEGYLFETAEEIKYGYIGFKIKNGMDMSSFGWGEVIYEVASSMELYNTAFCTMMINCHDSFYNFLCSNSNHMFGCVGLNRKSYCILNKQYSKEEYERMAERMVQHMKSTGEWGEFFPQTLSPFAYNETVANNYYPLSREEVQKKGWNWKEEDPKEFQNQTYTIPDNIHDVKEAITEAILSCEVIGKNYRIIPQELAFYKKMNLPIPHRHFETRHMDRLKVQNPHMLYARKCAKCQSEIQTTYSPDRPEIIYCESCYLNEVY